MWKATLFATVMAVVSINAMAEDAPSSYKVVAIKEITREDFKIVVKDQKNGVFLLAAGGWSGKYPKTTKMIRDIFLARGIKVTEDSANADVGLQFANFTGFSFDDIENQTTSIDGTKVLLFLGGGLATLFGNSDKAIMVSMIADAPLKITRRNSIDGQNKRNTSTEIEYKSTQKGADVYVSTVAAYLDDYINKHFVFDTPALPVAASSVPVIPVAASAIPVTTAAAAIVETPK
jgi:hypothetical protein